jgi:hypothetical protein
MEKTSVYLSAEERQRLEHLSKLERVSQAEIIRRAIREYRTLASVDREFSSVRSFDGPGGSIADLDEREALVGFGE